MSFDSRVKQRRPGWRGGLMRLLLRLPAWAYIVLSLGGLAAALTVALQRAS